MTILIGFAPTPNVSHDNVRSLVIYKFYDLKFQIKFESKGTN